MFTKFSSQVELRLYRHSVNLQIYDYVFFPFIGKSLNLYFFLLSFIELFLKIGDKMVIHIA